MIRERKGFTLIELLVVIAIIAILAAILFPIFAAARAKARAASCAANMSQIAKAIISYAGDFDDKFPCTRAPGTSGSGMTPFANIDFQSGAPLAFYGATWVERVDPYVSRGSLVDTDGPGRYSPGYLGMMGGVFNCPDRDLKWKATWAVKDWHSYGYNFLYLGLPWATANSSTTNPFLAQRFSAGATRVSRLESTSDTILLVENRSIWAYPPCNNTLLTDAQPNQTPIMQNSYSISPRHSDKVNVAYCDGHTRAVNPRELVRAGVGVKNKMTGAAWDNRLWDTVKSKYGM